VLERVDRATFLAEIWDYSPGQHVLFSEPTQGGKSTLAFQLLEVTDPLNRHMKPPIALIMKPRDNVPAEWVKRLGWREVQTWPPSPSLLHGSPPGYALWPKHELGLTRESLDRTNANLAHQFRKALLDTYKGGDRVVFADEIYGLLAELDLQEELTALWTRGGGMGAGLWSATQKASGTTQASIPGHAFNSPTHLFLGRDPDKRARDRAAEIGGIDPQFIADTIAHLKVNRIDTPYGMKAVSDKLYLNKLGPYAVIVGP
jgi:hypothetical protein